MSHDPQSAQSGRKPLSWQRLAVIAATTGIASAAILFIVIYPEMAGLFEKRGQLILGLSAFLIGGTAAAIGSSVSIVATGYLIAWVMGARPIDAYQAEMNRQRLIYLIFAMPVTAAGIILAAKIGYPMVNTSLGG